MKAIQAIQHLEPCHDAVKWLNNRSVRKAWQICNKPDWMLWAAEKLGIDRKPLLLAACDCAEIALKYVPKGEERPRKAIETARAWCEGLATPTDCIEAADAAAADAAAADAAAAAAAAAAYAAYADAADAAGAAAYAAAREKSNKKMAALVRKRIPVELIEEAICLS